jgi:nicotinate-nucleotide adenylyltransferase
MIGIYGGTFDPVHYGHLRTALEMQEIFALDEIRLIPCYQSPLKKTGSTTAQQRLEMLQLAIQNQPGFICDSREIERGGKSYMVDTLASLRSEFPNVSLLLFIGLDAFAHLDAWHQWQKLFDFTHLIVMTRPKSPQPALSDFFKQRLTLDSAELKTAKMGNLFFQNVTQLDISATEIRTLQANGCNIRFLLPDNVINYIKQHNLYQNYRNLNAN